MKCAAVAIFSALVLIIGAPVYARDVPALTLVQKIALNNVKGRIDHLSIDLRTRRLFIAAFGNNTIEIVDLNAGKRTRSIPGLSGPQDVVFIPALNKLYVSNAESGLCMVFDAASLALLDTIRFNDDADNMRSDYGAGKIYLGYGSGGIGVIDTATDTSKGDIGLPAHPESLQLETDGNRLFVNLPGAKEVAVVDRGNMSIAAHWQLKDAGGNFPMALDEPGQRLYVGCRNPAKLVVLDARSGKIIDEQKLDGDADDIYYDPGNKRIYISCGEGFIDVIAQGGVPDFRPVERIPTASGARTSLFVPETGTLYLAVPAGGGRQAEIWIYESR